jgi:hypothetical protein
LDFNLRRAFFFFSFFLDFDEGMGPLHLMRPRSAGTGYGFSESNDVNF